MVGTWYIMCPYRQNQCDENSVDMRNKSEDNCNHKGQTCMVEPNKGGKGDQE